MESAKQVELLRERIPYNEDVFKTSAEYSLTSDEEIDIYKEYYIRDGEGTEESPYKFIKVIEPDIEEISTYYERIDEGFVIYQKLIQRLLEDSKTLALSLRFPYKYSDFSELELPKRYYNWQLRCSQELYELIGSVNIKSYSENGLTWTRDTGYLSTQLVSEIEPMVGYLEEEIEEEKEEEE